MIAAVALSLASVALVACSPESGTADQAGSESPTASSSKIDPSNFVLPVDNPYFPLEPGTTLRYEGVKEGRRAVNVFSVSDRTKMILGVANTVVVDKLYVAGRLEEIAHDWCTQRSAWFL